MSRTIVCTIMCVILGVMTHATDTMAQVKPHDEIIMYLSDVIAARGNDNKIRITSSQLNTFMGSINISEADIYPAYITWDKADTMAVNRFGIPIKKPNKEKIYVIELTASRKLLKASLFLSYCLPL